MVMGNDGRQNGQTVFFFLRREDSSKVDRVIQENSCFVGLKRQ